MQPAGGALVHQQFFQTNERKLQSTGFEKLPPFIRGGEVNGFDGRKNVYAIRLPPHLNGVTGLGKIVRLEQFPESKLLDDSSDASRVAGIGRHPNIKVAGVSRVAVKRHRVTADDQLFNPV